MEKKIRRLYKNPIWQISTREWLALKRVLVMTTVLCLLIQVMQPVLVYAAEQGKSQVKYVPFAKPRRQTKMNKAGKPQKGSLRKPKKYYQTEMPEEEGTLVSVDEASKTYQMGKNQFRTVVGGPKDHYKDKNGKYRLLDNTLSKKGTGENAYYTNKASDTPVMLPTEISENRGIQMKSGNYQIEMIPLGGDFSRSSAEENAVLYNDVLDGVDYQYSIVENSIKEDIVLNYRIEQNEFKFEVDAGELTVALKDGEIIA